MKKLVYILSVLFIFTVFNYTWITNAIDPVNMCWDTELVFGEICCDGDPYMGIECPQSNDEWVRQCWDHCDWIKLNTCFPIIWDCIETKAAATNPTNAFPYMIWALTKIIMSVILVVCFILVIVAWIMRAADKPDPAKKMLKRVAITILLLWLSGVILKLVNPNFFY